MRGLPAEGVGRDYRLGRRGRLSPPTDLVENFEGAFREQTALPVRPEMRGVHAGMEGDSIVVIAGLESLWVAAAEQSKIGLAITVDAEHRVRTEGKRSVEVEHSPIGMAPKGAAIVLRDGPGRVVDVTRDMERDRDLQHTRATDGRQLVYGVALMMIEVDGFAAPMCEKGGDAAVVSRERMRHHPEFPFRPPNSSSWNGLESKKN